MTYRAFLAALRKTLKHTNWKLTRLGEIRTPDGKCPLGALIEDSDDPEYYQRPWPEDGADYLGLSREEADDIARASDYPAGLYGTEKSVRRDLLRACGLKERP